MRHILLVFLLLVLTACTTGPATVSPMVTRFSGPTLPSPGKTFTILPYPEQQGSLAFDSYAQRMQGEMEKLGWRPVKKNANYVMMFSYEAGAPYTKTETRVDYHPVRDWEPCSFRSGRRQWCWDTDYISIPRMDVQTLWPVRVRAVLYEGPARQGRKQAVWEGESRLDSGSPDMTLLIGPLIEALFINFPGPQGIPQRYTVPLSVNVQQ